MSSSILKFATADKNGVLKIWNALDGKLINTININNDTNNTNINNNNRDINGIAFSPNGKLLAVANDTLLKVFDVKTGKLVNEYEDLLNTIWCVAFSPDGKKVAFGCWYDCRIFDLDKDEVTGVLFDHLGFVMSVAYSNDGKWIATGSCDHKVKMWDTTSGLLIHTLEGHTDCVYSVAISKCNKLLASAGRDGKVNIWNPLDGALLQTINYDHIVHCVVFSSNYVEITIAQSNSVIKNYDIVTKTEVHCWEETNKLVCNICYSSNGQFFANVGKNNAVKIYNTTTKKIVQELPPHKEPVKCIAFAPLLA